MKQDKIICVTNSASQTKKLGFLLAKMILECRPGKTARVLALRGELGAGKTNFVQGFAKELGIKAAITSPTFSIIKKYPIGSDTGFKTFCHIDCYRLDNAKDLAQLGFADLASDLSNIIAVEWPEIAKDILPKDFLKVEFEVVGQNSRRVIFNF